MQSSLSSNALLEGSCAPRDKFEQASRVSFLRTVTLLIQSGMELREIGKQPPQSEVVSNVISEGMPR